MRAPVARAGGVGKPWLTCSALQSNRVPVSIVETACALLASDPSGRADSGPGRMEQLYSLYRLHGKPRRGDKKAAADSAKLHALLTFVRSLDPYRAAIASQLRDMARGVPVPEPSQEYAPWVLRCSRSLAVRVWG